MWRGSRRSLLHCRYLKFAVQLIARVESSFNSVERLLSYSDLPPEAPATIAGKEAPEGWPQRGVVEFKDVWMRYRPELDPVLRVRQNPDAQ